MVRAANTGVTCFINEFGKITQILVDENGSQFTEGTLTGPVAIVANPELTFYVRHGEVFARAGHRLPGPAGASRGPSGLHRGTHPHRHVVRGRLDHDRRADP